MPTPRTAFVSAAMLAGIVHGQLIGPSTGESAYLLPVEPGVVTESLFTVGDSVNLKPDGVNPYRLVGIPDGIGAFDNGDGTLTLLVNHELASGEGIARAHGGNAAFVSTWTIDSGMREVLHGEDLIQRVFYYNTTTLEHTYLPNALMYRLCSADLAPLSAFYNHHTGLGTTERIFTNGEEGDSNGRAFAHVVTGPEAGDSFEIAHAGNAKFENFVANPIASDATVVVGTDDSSTGELYLYIGTKQAAGNTIEKAGLGGGNCYGVRLSGYPSEPAAAIGPTTFDMYNLGDVSTLNGVQIASLSIQNSVTKFARPEDAHWNPRDPYQLIFATTGSGSVPSRLWSLRFPVISDFTTGGTAEILISGADGPQSMDNITVDDRFNVLIQEDRGSSSSLARIWNYNLKTGELTVLAQADPARFLSGPGFLTNNEESSGIIDATDTLGPGWFLLSMQAHYSPGDVELDEGGQLVTMYSPMHADCSWADVTTQGPAEGEPGFGVPDGLITGADILYFVNAWLAQDTIADITYSGAGCCDFPYGTPDGVNTSSDLNLFVNLWVAGCP